MSFKLIFVGMVSVFALASCHDNLASKKSSEIYSIESGSLGITDTDLVEFGVGWVPILLSSIKKLEAEELSEYQVTKECYKIVLYKDEQGFNSVSFLSADIEFHGEAHASEKTASARRRVDECGPAVTYLYRDDGTFVTKHYMRH